MKIEFEKIEPDLGSSFKVIPWKSKDDRFFWHQHPEYEIIYVKKGQGKLHIGNHLGSYIEGAVMFLGPNLPHSGLGYGVIGEHEEIIVQLNENFLGKDFLNAPELFDVKSLFERAIFGISFFGKTQEITASKLEKLLSLEGIERLLTLLEILKILALSSEFSILNTRDSRNDFRHKDEGRINRIYSFVEENYKQEIAMIQIAEIANLSLPSFCRYFKKMTQMTFTDFLNDFRINNACKLLHLNHTIADVCFESGFNNISHFNKTFKKIKGKSPSKYRNEILKTKQEPFKYGL
jgi:AraC-like DNA-binding protein